MPLVAICGEEKVNLIWNSEDGTVISGALRFRSLIEFVGALFGDEVVYFNEPNK